MSHQIAKLMLEKADTFLARTEAVAAAMQMGMPLHEIEEYLDWLDMMRSRCGKAKNDDDSATDEAAEDADG